MGWVGRLVGWRWRKSKNFILVVYPRDFNPSLSLARLVASSSQGV
jgi:hypothetical protein